MNFETQLDRLEKIVEKMEKGDLALEDSLKLFEEGVKLSRDCNQQLMTAEQKVRVLLGVDDSGEIQSTEFKTSDKNDA